MMSLFSFSSVISLLPLMKSMNFFDIPEQDQSVRFLHDFFGTIGKLFSSTMPEEATIMGYLFGAFNEVILVIGIIVMIYVTVMGLLMTAHEGKFLGGKWSSLWVPVRMVLGIVALYPIPILVKWSGVVTKIEAYSTLQVFLMWIVLQGVGAADFLWTKALGFVVTQGSPYAKLAIVGVGKTVETEAVMRGAFRGVTCAATEGYQRDYNFGDHYVYLCKNLEQGGAIHPACRYFFPLSRGGKSVATYNIGVTPKICGYLSISDSQFYCKDSASLECLVSKAQQSIIENKFKEFLDIASWAIEADEKYLLFWDWRIQNINAKDRKAPYIIQYCNSKQIKEEDCCIKRETMDSEMNVRDLHGEAGMLKAVKNIANCPVPKTGAFPSALGGKYNEKFPEYSTLSNPTYDAVRDIYYPFFIKPKLLEREQQDKEKKPNFIQQAVIEYHTQIGQVISDWISKDTTKSHADDISSWPKEYQIIQSQGWMLAGSVYVKLAKMNQSFFDQAYPVLTYESAEVNPSDMAGGARANTDTATYLLSLIDTEFGNKTKSEKVLPLEKVETKGKGVVDYDKALDSWSSSIMSSFMALIGTTDINPVASVQAFGSTLLTLTIAVYFLVGGLFVGMAAATGWTFFGVSTGLATAIQVLLSWLGPYLTLLFGSLMLFSATLAVYVPLIPYIIFLMGALGWFISVIEAIVAAPLIAIGVIAPGEHDILGHAKPSLMLMLNVLLRPSLMILGMIGSMLLAKIGIQLLNMSFKNVVAQTGLILLIFYICAYCSLVIIVLQKCFSLISHVPDRVLGWIGQGATGETGEAAVGKISGAVETAGAKEAGAKAEMGTGGAAVAGARKKHLEEGKKGKTGLT